MIETISYMAMPNLYQQRMALQIRTKKPLEARIIESIRRRYGIDFERLKEQNRHRELVFVRQLAMETIRRRCLFSLKQIGHLFERDHTTVIHAKQCIQDYLDTGYRKDEILRFLNSDF